MAPNVFETKNYNEKENSTCREDGELHIFITIVTITMSMIIRNSYRRGFAIRIIPEVPNQSFPDGYLKAVRVDVSGECFASKLAFSKLSRKETNDCN